MPTTTASTDETSSSSHQEAKSTESTINNGCPPSVMALASKIPTVTLDIDVVVDNMAARLCISFIGHVLFLKNQVPFPVMQLARMPMHDSTSRAAKKRHELLTSFDTLTSHMYTTFIALSTAMALRGTREAQKLVPEAANQGCRVGRAFLSVVLGPSIGAAKARVIVGIDGLEEKVWGLRDEKARPNTVDRDKAEEDDDESHSHCSSESEAESEEDNEEEGVVTSDEEEDEEDGGGSQSDDNSLNASPPPSRSPSPSHSSGSSPSSSSPRELSPPPQPPPLYRVGEHECLRAAERLLSRTLASACAEDDGRGMASEMAPTQTHILLRAPRRFSHPSWTPRQNLSTSLDGHLTEFLEESGDASVSANATRKKRKNAATVEGIWIKSRMTESRREVDEEPDEEDEMIWWSWDGKLVGFADW